MIPLAETGCDASIAPPFSRARALTGDRCVRLRRADRVETMRLDVIHNVLAANFGQSGRGVLTGDFNFEGGVNLADFNLLAARFGQALSPAAAGTGKDDLEELLAGR